MLAPIALRFIDTPAARAEIQRRLDAALGGRVTWQALEVRLLPAPHGELRQVRIDIPGTLAADAERVQVYLRIWPLLRGRPEIASVTLDKPRIRIAAADGKDEEKAQLDTMAAYRAVAEPLVRALQQFAGETTLRLRGAELAGPFALRNLNVSASSGATGLDMELEADNALWKRLRVNGRLGYADLATQLTARIDDVDLPAAMALAGVSIGASEGRVSANAVLQVDTTWRGEIEISGSGAALQIAGLPWKLTLQSAQIGVNEKQLSVKGGRGALGESTFTEVAAQVELAGAPRLSAGSARATLADQLLRWAVEKAGAPAELELKAPVQVAARRITWNQAAGLGVEADLAVDGGPRIGVAFGWKPERFELRRLAIKDAQSDATLSAAVGKDFFQAGFSGVLHAQSIASLRRQPEPRTGRVQGELRLAFDRARPLQSSGEGKLEVATLDLSVLAGRPALVERADFVVAGGVLRIERARAVIDEQVVELSGEIRSTDQGPVVDARLESPGVVLARLAPPQKPAADSPPSSLWPLPVTGRIAVRAGFVQLARQRIEPFEGSAVLERERARLDVKEARMCGVSFPLQLDATPERYSVAARLAMKDEPFESAIKCLTGDSVQISGNADLRAELRTQGKVPEELLRNLTGSAEAELRKGRVHRFALIGNILSVQNLTSIRDPREIDKGFPYRSMTARGRFEGGGFLIEEGFFDSDAARIAVNGRVDLVGADSQLNVLVGLISSVDRVTGAIPIVGNVLGGTLIALPVSVSGDIRDPRVVPLGRHAVSDRLLGIFERTLKLPGKLVPGEEKEPTREPKAP